MDFDRVKLEQDDASHMDRVGPGVRELFNTYNFYYIKQFPIKNLVKLFNADVKELASSAIASKFYNLDYRMLEHWDDTEWIDWFTRAFYYLVTSFDEEGVKVPLNLYENHFFHPGGKRVCIGTYLGMKSVPVLLQTTQSVKKFNLKINSIDELQNVYPSNNFTAFIRSSPDETIQPLEIHYLESMIKTSDNIDGWMERGQGILNDFSTMAPPLYLLKHGLNVVNPNIEESVRVEQGANGYEYKTIFSKKPLPIGYFIKLNDLSLYNENFWKLAYYFDPRYRVKYSKKKELEIRNTHDFATKEMKSTHMLKTLTKDKVIMPVTRPALGQWKLKV